MINSSDIKTEFLVRNQLSTTAGFVTDTNLNDWLDAAHKWSAGYKKWPLTEGRVSTTFASLGTSEDGWLVGEYPEGWKPDSIRLLTIGGKRVDKKNFYKFQSFLEDNSSTDDRIFTDHGLRYYVNPNIDVSGSVTVWGQYTPADLDGTDLTAKTVFSSSEEGNEAIVEMMTSYLKKREIKLSESLAHIKEAGRILDELWKRIEDEQYQYQTTNDDGMFKRIDVIQGGMRDDIFNRDQFN